MKAMITLFFLAVTIYLYGQSDSTHKSRKNFKYYFGHIPLKKIQRSTKFDVQLDTRNSFVKDFPINVYGVNVGVILRERFRIGGGYYWLNQSFNDKLLGIYDQGSLAGRVIVTSKGIPVPVSTLEKLAAAGKVSFVPAAQQIDLWFASIGFMYTFYVSRLIEFAIPVEIGYGGFSEKLYDNTGNNFSSLSSSLKPQATVGNFVPGQIGFDVLLKPHKWIYLEGSIGYRKTLTQDYTSKYRATSFDSQFDGEYYNIGVKIQLGTIVKDWKAWRKSKTKPEPNK